MHARTHRWSTVRVAAGLAALLGIAAPAFPHHSFTAEFDSSKRVTLTGTVTKIEWTNPHAYLYVDAADETGATGNWAVEMGSPNGLTRLGWTRTMLKVGDAVRVEGSRAKFKPHLANAQAVILVATGQKLGAASSEKAK